MATPSWQIRGRGEFIVRSGTGGAIGMATMSIPDTVSRPCNNGTGGDGIKLYAKGAVMELGIIEIKWFVGPLLGGLVVRPLLKTASGYALVKFLSDTFSYAGNDAFRTGMARRKR